MTVPSFLGVVALVGIVLAVRHLAIRRVVARQGRYLWLVFLPSLVFPVLMLWVASTLVTSAPVAAVAFATIGLAYLGLFVRFVARMSRAVSATAPEADLSAALTEPLADHRTTMVGLILIGGLVAVVALVILAVVQSR